jgi:hypothetical protein
MFLLSLRSVSRYIVPEYIHTYIHTHTYIVFFLGVKKLPTGTYKYSLLSCGIMYR